MKYNTDLKWVKAASKIAPLLHDSQLKKITTGQLNQKMYEEMY